MAEHIYDNAAQQRILAMVMTLAGHELHGLTNKDLAEGLSVSAGTITRDLHNLVKAGFAEQIAETGRYRLGPKPVRISVAHMAEMERATSRLAETKNRYSREP
jgi:DNA-binding IclR family transcriptional regulator